MEAQPAPMRREDYRMDRDAALRLLERAPYVHMASTDGEGRPVLRALHAVVCDGWLCFHGAPVGEKCSVLGREAVFSAEEVIAEVPSYWSDPVLACPATTLYLSAHVRGVVDEITVPETRARVLQALMGRFQPEGGHAPVDVADPRYTKQVAGLLVAGVRLDALDGKGKLAQNRTPPKIVALVENLWSRGRDGDARAAALVMRANATVPRPARFVGPEGVALEPAFEDDALPDVCALLRDTYWHAGRSPDADLADAHRASAAWVGARDEHGAVIASARAVSDGVRYAYVADVVVHPAWRGRGVGAAVMTLLLDHPRVRRVSRVELATRDAMAFYAAMGFVETGRAANGAYERVTMALRRG